MAYGVEGWGFEQLPNAGKLDRDTYLAFAAKVTIGFARRLAEAKADEPREGEAAVPRAVTEARRAPAQRLLPMKTFSVAAVGFGMFGLMSFNV